MKNSPEWERIKEIFNAALELEGRRRRDFLVRVCAGDENLQARVETLLRSFDTAFLESPAVAQFADQVLEPHRVLAAGESVGGFRIIRSLGSGGQGMVYLASDPELDRYVAVKILPSSARGETEGIGRLKREARAAAALSHPNICTVHRIDLAHDPPFIVMQFVAGETLAEILRRGPLDIETSIRIAAQIADALSAAHSVGVVHRDIKPSNVIMAEDGRAIVLDFGLAKLETPGGRQTTISQPGVVMGTAAYMSPEQVRGETLDSRTDVWSLGVCLLEMLTGRNPFLRNSLGEIFAAILTESVELTGAPDELTEILTEALQRDPSSRTRSAASIRDTLRSLTEEQRFNESLKSRRFAALQIRIGAGKWIGALTILAVVAGVLAYLALSGSAGRKAADEIDRVAELAAAGKTFDAYDLAVKIRPELPESPELKKIEPLFADTLTVHSDPPGAKVFLRRFQKAGDRYSDWFEIGQTPIESMEIARGQYLVRVELDGYASMVRSVSGRFPDYVTDLIGPPALSIDVKLRPAAEIPEGMTLVPGGEYRLVSYTRPYEKPVNVGDFLIDKFEVSNAQYRKFILAGGYSNADLWPRYVEVENRRVQFSEAVKRFVDQTGLPAPRGWTDQNYPSGHESDPVTGVSWYEAMAYARFLGKDLPTIFEWEKAARDGMFDEGWDTMPWGRNRQFDPIEELANFASSGPKPVDSYEFGASPYGCLNVAGNVSEFVRNRRGRLVLAGGGSWRDRPYSFGYYGSLPPTYAPDNIGFRLVKRLTDADGGAADFEPASIPKYRLSTAAQFKNWASHYDYDRTPLNAAVTDRTENEWWVRERVEFNAADGERAIGYLYLPKNAKPPFQIVHSAPAADVPLGYSSLTHATEEALSPIIKSGRAVFAVALKGYSDRPAPTNEPLGPIGFRKRMVSEIVDWRRGLDYLESRPDIDVTRLAFMGVSWGGIQGVIATAVDARYRTAIYVAIGVRPDWLKWADEAQPMNFAPHIKVSKFLIKGEFDEAHPLETESRPLFELMTEPKTLDLVESGHLPPPRLLSPRAIKWLDQVFGPVN